MPHVIEPASSGRAKCRGCGETIAKDDLRFGEQVDNPYGEGERSLWFHLRCAAFKRPEPFLEALGDAAKIGDDLDFLRREAEAGVAHRRMARIDGAGRSPTSRARCRACRELIDKDAWRIQLVWWEDARFSPSGFIHARCVRSFVESTSVMPRISHFAAALSDDELEEIRQEIDG